MAGGIGKTIIAANIANRGIARISATNKDAIIVNDMINAAGWSSTVS